MDKFVVTMAKLAGIRTAVYATLIEKGSAGRERREFDPSLVVHYFIKAKELVNILRSLARDLYEDFHEIDTLPGLNLASHESPYFSRSQLERLVRDIDQIFELRANSELMTIAETKSQPHQRVFITHGRSQDWREVQSYIEKDIGFKTLELAQEVNSGRTIIEKLCDNSDLCDSVAIVMTGEDVSADGTARARENVMHEIGFFQGKYGRSKVILLHEDGVSIPTNLSGVVYIPFPKGLVSAGFHVLSRELIAIYK